MAQLTLDALNAMSPRDFVAALQDGRIGFGELEHVGYVTDLSLRCHCRERASVSLSSGWPGIPLYVDK